MVCTGAPKTGPQILGMYIIHTAQHPLSIIHIFSSSEKLKLYRAVLKHFFLSNILSVIIYRVWWNDYPTHNMSTWNSSGHPRQILIITLIAYWMTWNECTENAFPSLHILVTFIFHGKKIRSFTWISKISGNKMNVLIFAHSI